MITYEQCDPIPNKILQPDGSITTFEGILIAPADATRAARYMQADPVANKVVNEDGALSTLPGAAIYLHDLRIFSDESEEDTR